jgi:phenylacetate-CoA ligase
MSAEETPRPSRAYELSVVVPCFNEELNVPELTARVLHTFDMGRLAGELVMVDDGSRDGTRRVIEEQMRLHPERVVGQFHVKNSGMAAAWRTGVDAARGANVATIDADLQYQPEDLLRLYRTLLESSVDIVQGFRSSVGRLRDGRFVLSRGLNVILNGAFGMHLRDNKSGFVCCAKEVMQDLLRYKGSYSYWQSFIMVAAHSKGYSYREIETLFEDRKQGQSFLDGQAYRASARNLVDVGRAFWEYRLNAPPRDAALRVLQPSAPAVRPAPSSLARRVQFRARALPLRVGARTVERLFETLDATQWLSQSQLHELQSEKLRRLVRHAYRTVPYYRARMQERRLHPEDVRSLDDLHKLPLLTKDDVRQHLHFDMIKEGVSPADLVRVQTSGRDGKPFVCYVGRSDVAFRLAAELRALEWTGFRLGEPSVRLSYRAELAAQAHEVRDLVENVAGRRTIIPVLGLSPPRLDVIAREFRNRGPILLEADVEILCALAVHFEANGVEARPRAIVATGQTLSTAQRAKIAAAFGCPIFSSYRAREFSGLACETGAPGEHLTFAEGLAIELLVDGRPAMPGEAGEVVVTDLNNQVMPLIRYRLGDIASAVDPAVSSACGRGLPRIGTIHGRASAIVRGTDGRFVGGSFFSDLFADYAFAVRQFRVVQTDPGTISLQLVRGSRYSEDTMDQIHARIRAELGADLSIEVGFSESLDVADSAVSARASAAELTL